MISSEIVYNLINFTIWFYCYTATIYSWVKPFSTIYIVASQQIYVIMKLTQLLRNGFDKMTNNMDFDTEMATEYDKGVRRTLPTYDALFRLVQTYLRKHTKKDADVLIVGAGGGTELAILGPGNPQWTFTAVDPAAPMLDLARDKAQHLQLVERVKFIEGTIDDVETDSLYDASTFMLVFHFIQDDSEKLQQLTNIRKRLKSGAPFILASMYGNPGSAEFDELFSLWKAYWLDATNLTAGEMDEMEATVRGLSFIPEEKIVAMLSEAGFGNIAKFFTTNMFGGWICRAI